MLFLKKLQKLEESELFSKESTALLSNFYHGYKNAIIANGGDINSQNTLLCDYLDFIIEQLISPFPFDYYHKKIIEPFNFFKFGLDFIRPVVNLQDSTICGEEKITEIKSHLKKGENVILFSNHQTEPDPQAICLLLEKSHPQLANNMIFVAGHRVTTDPLAVPFSKGLNLLCIYSKNYLNHPPEKRDEKVLHNQRTMKKMRELLSEGGKCIYVAPSGGRDRPNKHGIIEVSPFDGKSIGLFWLTASHSARLTHFYPIALSTFDLLPPPEGRKMELGEPRQFNHSPIHLAVGEEIDMVNFPGSNSVDKKQGRVLRAEFIWNIVRTLYNEIN